MIELTFKDLSNTSKLIRTAEQLADQQESLIDKACIKNIPLNEGTHLMYLLGKITTAGKINKKQYGIAVKKFISYAVKINLTKESFNEYIDLKKYRKTFEHNYKKKQGLIIVIESALKKLPEFISYLEKISKNGQELKYDKELVKAYKQAKKDFDNLSGYYENRPKPLLRILCDKYNPNVENRFSKSNYENAVLMRYALEMIDAEKKKNYDAFKRINNFPSLAKYWLEEGKDFQSLTVNQLKKFLRLIRWYTNNYHRNDLKEEDKEASRQSSMKHFLDNNPEWVTREEKKQKVFELYEKYKDFKKVSQILQDTPYYVSRQTISKWINKPC